MCPQAGVTHLFYRPTKSNWFVIHSGNEAKKIVKGRMCEIEGSISPDKLQTVAQFTLF